MSIALSEINDLSREEFVRVVGPVFEHSPWIAEVAAAQRPFPTRTALHGAMICNQPSIVQYLLDQGAKPDVKNRLGWTPLMVAKGLYIANNKKEFPAAAELLKKALAARGLPIQ